MMDDITKTSIRIAQNAYRGLPNDPDTHKAISALSYEIESSIRDAVKWEQELYFEDRKQSISRNVDLKVRLALCKKALGDVLLAPCSATGAEGEEVQDIRDIAARMLAMLDGTEEMPQLLRDERERCAIVAENLDSPDTCPMCPRDVADAIRALP